MSYLSNMSETETETSWAAPIGKGSAGRSWCLTEFSTLGLVLGALVFAAVLWVAIFAVL